MANTTDMPITKTKVGNTRAVAVRPFQAAWFMKCHAPRPPLLLTMIMNAIVIPRATSRERSLRAGSPRRGGLVIAVRPRCDGMRVLRYATRTGPGSQIAGYG